VARSAVDSTRVFVQREVERRGAADAAIRSAAAARNAVA
jgi:hypothetical protein